MDNFLGRVLNLLVSQPGNMIYHLVLAFSLVTAFQAILANRSTTDSRLSRRMLLGFSLLIFGQGVLFIVSGLTWQGLVNPHAFFPPLERAVMVLSVLWITWLWAFPTPERRADAAAGLLSLLLVIGFLITASIWGNYPPETTFTGIELDWAWQLAGILLLLGGIFILVLRRPSYWALGAAVMVINLAGHVAHLIWPMAGSDFAGAVRLAQLCTFPILPVLGQRLRQQEVIAPALPSPALPLPLPQAVKAAPGVIRERRRYAADPRAVFDWLQLTNAGDQQQVYREFTRAFAQTMLADMAFLVRAPDEQGMVNLLCGYDLIREEYLPGASLERSQVSSLANALHKGRALRLGGESGPSPDLEKLADAIGIKDPGNLMLVPLNSPPKHWGGVILLSPYSQRAWSVDDQTYLLSSIESMIAVLQRPTSALKELESKPAGAGELAPLRAQVDTLQKENQRLVGELNTLRATHPGGPEVEALLAVQQETQELISGLQADNERLQEMLRQGGPQITGTTGDMERAHLETELRGTLQQLAHLQNALADSNIQVLNLQKQLAEGTTDQENQEVVQSIVQELRQPMASIVGYTDLLLAESAGILGALQRKFLERVKSSIERLQTLLNDLTQVIAMNASPLELTPQPVNASALIDDAVAGISSQLREKNISLDIDLPDELPEIHADRDALQQIVAHLLQNASSATPVEGSIRLAASLSDADNGEKALLLQVTDSGGGIATEDLPRVFARRYRADNPLIQGVGDSGVGLSIAKTLVEAHHGRIWVESQPGVTTTFTVLLPLQAGHEAKAALP